MNSLILLGLIFFALTFCGLSDRLKSLQGNTGSGSNSASNSSKGSTTDAEKPSLSSAQQAIADKATETKWDEQGMSWRFPSGWKKMDVKKEQFNYNGPDNAFFSVTISTMSNDFPVDSSLTAYYDEALQQMRNGKYEKARYLAIDGIKGVEFIESPPEDKSGVRRHQWIAYRNYLGQSQMLNVMLSTTGTVFEKHRDDFPAILYSMKSTK